MNTPLPQIEKTFSCCGYAARSDFETQEWKSLYHSLDEIQTEFLKSDPMLRSPDYKWPRDALHNWSRIWEYPYVYFHLQQYCQNRSGLRPLRVADVGSGVTFFPFSIARMGYHVTCTDIDPIAERDLRKAIEIVEYGPGNVEFCAVKGDRLPFADSEFDAIYSISVLEHVPEFEDLVKEIARVLVPGGVFILTFDLAIKGTQGLSPHDCARLKDSLIADFDIEYGYRDVHPGDILYSNTGLYPNPLFSLGKLQLYIIKQFIKPLIGKTRLCYAPDPDVIAVEGMVLRKRG